MLRSSTSRLCHICGKSHLCRDLELLTVSSVRVFHGPHHKQETCFHSQEPDLCRPSQTGCGLGVSSLLTVVLLPKEWPIKSPEVLQSASFPSLAPLLAS